MAFFDIEDALQAQLRLAGFNACAKPLPSGFSMPHVTVVQLNAWDENFAQAVYSVDFDVRCGGYAEAVRVQNAVANWVHNLPGRDVGGVPCYQIDSLRLQQAQPDASHPTAILATVSANLRMRLAD